MQLVERMTMVPNHCMVCGKGNTENADGTIGPFLDLGIDYNYGDSGYLCMECIHKVAAHGGWPTPDEFKDLQRENEKQAKEIHDLTSELEIKQRKVREQQRTLGRITEGSKELKKLRKAKASA